MDSEILTEQKGGLAILTLNRPHAMNMLTLGMCREISGQLGRWAADPDVHAVLVRGAGDHAFCAGTEVRDVLAAVRAGAYDTVTDLFREECSAVLHVHHFPKPVIAVVNGITMGSGAGLSIHGSYRIASERAVLAVPEAALGLFPDLGASMFLNRCPGKIGRYLGLTGARIWAGDASYCSLVTHRVPHKRIDELSGALAALRWREGEERAQLEHLLVDFTVPAGPASLARLQPAIDRCFSPSTVEEIVDALEGEEEPWAKAALRNMAKASPTSLKVTLRRLQIDDGTDLTEVLKLDCRLLDCLVRRGDFREGVHAILIDKNHEAQWQPASLSAISEEMIASCFRASGSPSVS